MHSSLLVPTKGCCKPRSRSDTRTARYHPPPGGSRPAPLPGHRHGRQKMRDQDHPHRDYRRCKWPSSGYPVPVPSRKAPPASVVGLWRSRRSTPPERGAPGGANFSPRGLPNVTATPPHSSPLANRSQGRPARAAGTRSDTASAWEATKAAAVRSGRGRPWRNHHCVTKEPNPRF